MPPLQLRPLGAGLGLRPLSPLLRGSSYSNRELTEEERDSLLVKLGKKLLGGLAMAGNFLELPLSSLRDVVAGENPLDQYLTPFSPENRVQMPELLGPKYMGVLGPNKPGLDWGDVVAFGADVVADPLSYVTLGGAAFAKTGAGAVAKKIGLNRFAPKVFEKGGVTGGKRFYRTAATLGEAIEASPNTKYFEKAAEVAAGGAEALNKLRGQKIGGFLGLSRRPVFGRPDWLWQGPTAEKAAAAMDQFFGKIRYSPPGRWAARTFTAPIQDASTAFLQKLAPKLWGARQIARFSAHEFPTTLKAEAARMDMVSEAGSDALRNVLEATDDAAEHYIERAANQFEKADAASLRQLREKYQANQEKFKGRARAVGVDPNELADPELNHVTRHMTRGMEPISDETIDLIPGTTAYAERQARKPWLRGVLTTTWKRLFKDPDVQRALRAEDAKLSDVTSVMRKKYSHEIPEFYQVDEGGELVPHNRYEEVAQSMFGMPNELLETGVFGNPVWDDVGTGFRHMAEATEAGKFNAMAIAKAAREADRPLIPGTGEALQQKKIQKGTKVVHDEIPVVGQVRRTKNKDSIVEWLDPATGQLKAKEYPTSKLTPVAFRTPVARPGYERLTRVLADVRMKQGGVDEGALRAVWNELYPKARQAPRAFDVEALKHSLISKELADDIRRVAKRFDAPMSAKQAAGLYDSLLNTWKGLNTAMILRLAFHFRNYASGHVRNMFDQMLDWSGEVVGGTLAKGKTLSPELAEKFRQIPSVAEEARMLGFGPDIRAMTDAQISDAARALAQRTEVITRFQGEALSRPGAAEAVGAGAEQMLGEFPGGGIAGQFSPATPGRVVRTLFDPKRWGPKEFIKIRGVGKATETGNPLFAAGEVLSKLVEDRNRLGAFYTLLKRGYDPVEASNLVRWAQVDYAARAYTPTEEVLMRIFPFYKFAKGATLHTLKELSERPGGPLAKIIKAEGAGRDPKEPIPEYIAHGLAMPIPADTPIIGQPGVERYLTGFGLMHEQDPFAFLGSPREAGMELLSRMSPMIKAPIEGITGQSFFQRGPGGARALEDLDPLIGRTISNITGAERPVRLPPWMEQTAANVAGSPLAMLRTAFDPRKNLAAKGLNIFTGMRVSDVTPAAREAMQREAATQIMRRMPGARVYEKVYFSKEELAAMPPGERAEAELWQAYGRELAEEAKKRAKARDKLSKLRKAY